MEEKKCCGNCKWEMMQGRGDPNASCSANYHVEWVCANSRSDYYGCDCADDDTCDEWEGSRQERTK